MLNRFCIRLSSRSQRGFTLIEILVVVAIIALLIVTLFSSFTKQRLKAEDARIKADLERLRIAFEDYYNDNNCYPPLTWFDSSDDCGSDLLKPYLNIMPCNPKTAMPYVLEYPTSQCSSFKLYSTLANLDDPSILDLCVSSGGSLLGNYGVSSTNVLIGIDCSAFPSPPSSLPPGFNDGRYGCQELDRCDDYGSPENAAANCLYSFAENSCGDNCDNPLYLCDL